MFRRKTKGNHPHAGLTASYQVNEAHDNSFAHALIWILGIALIALLCWAAVTPVYEVVSGRGQIKPEGLTTRVEHLEGGIVAEVAVQGGDSVAKGDVLLRLDDGDLSAEKAKLVAQSVYINQAIDRFQRLLNLRLDEEGAVENVLTLTNDEGEADETIRFRLAQIAAMRAQIGVAEAQIDALTAQLSVLRREYEIQAGQRDRVMRNQSDVFSLIRREELEREGLRLQSALAQLEGEITIKTATFAGLAADEAELIAQYRSEAKTRRQELMAEKVRVTQSISQLNDRLDRLVLRASVSGTVGAMTIQGRGEVIAAGEPLMEIVPGARRNIAEIEIPADRIGGVTVGGVASLKVLTYDFTRYGDITARVDRISPNSYRSEDGANMYRLQLSFPNNQLDISPGMTVMADIKSNRRTILSYLLKPVRVLTDRAFTEA